MWQKLQKEEQVEHVTVTLSELFQGGGKDDFVYERLRICRGCRADSTMRDETECQGCGRCPPEVREVPKMQGPFMVGSRTVEVESREKCRKEPVMIKGIRIPPNAKDGSRLSVRGQMRGKVLGHQTPGRLPGPVKLVVKRIPDLIYRAEGDDNLYTVLSISLGESLYGFKRQWQLFSDPDQVKIIRVGMVTQPGEVMRLPRKGMHNDRGGRGDLYVRIEVKYPTTSPGEGSIVPPTAAEAEEAYTVKKPE